jgi:hypothetical protein
MEFVIAVYNEDISWVEENEINSSSCIYLKMEREVKDIYKSVEKLPNVGREGHTFLYHIIKNYESLADVTVFTQGRISDQCPNLVSKSIELNGSKNYEILGLTYNITNFSCIHHVGIPIREVCETLFENPPSCFSFSVGAFMYVPKELILSKPKQFYERCLKILEKDINPIEGFIFERIWGLIFDPNIIPRK